MDSLLPVQQGQHPVFSPVCCRNRSVRGSVPHAIPIPGWVNWHFKIFFLCIFFSFWPTSPRLSGFQSFSSGLEPQGQHLPLQSQSVSSLWPAERPSLTRFGKVALPASCLSPYCLTTCLFSLLIHMLACLSLPGLLCHSRMWTPSDWHSVLRS